MKIREQPNRFVERSNSVDPFAKFTLYTNGINCNTCCRCSSFPSEICAFPMALLTDFALIVFEQIPYTTNNANAKLSRPVEKGRL